MSFELETVKSWKPSDQIKLHPVNVWEFGRPVKWFWLRYCAWYLIAAVKYAVWFIRPNEDILLTNLLHAINVHFIVTYLSDLWPVIIVDNDKLPHSVDGVIIRTGICFSFNKVGWFLVGWLVDHQLNLGECPFKCSDLQFLWLKAGAHVWVLAKAPKTSVQYFARWKVEHLVCVTYSNHRANCWKKQAVDISDLIFFNPYDGHLLCVFAKVIEQIFGWLKISTSMDILVSNTLERSTHSIRSPLSMGPPGKIPSYIFKTQSVWNSAEKEAVCTISILGCRTIT